MLMKALELSAKFWVYTLLSFIFQKDQKKLYFFTIIILQPLIKIEKVKEEVLIFEIEKKVISPNQKKSCYMTIVLIKTLQMGLEKLNGKWFIDQLFIRMGSSKKKTSLLIQVYRKYGILTKIKVIETEYYKIALFVKLIRLNSNVYRHQSIGELYTAPQGSRRDYALADFVGAGLR